MATKDYDTLQPIPSQAERDLSFLDASMEVTDFSNSQQLRTTRKLRKRPWFGFKMNHAGRAMQALTICFIALLGFVFGLSVLGIPLKSSNIYLLFRYGYTEQSEGVQLVKFEGSLLEGPDDQHYFKVRGLVFNFDNEFKKPQDFILTLFNQDRKFLEKFQFSCCDSDFFPRKIKTIEETFPVSSDKIGYFELKKL